MVRIPHFHYSVYFFRAQIYERIFFLLFIFFSSFCVGCITIMNYSRSVAVIRLRQNQPDQPVQFIGHKQGNV